MENTNSIILKILYKMVIKQHELSEEKVYYKQKDMLLWVASKQ